MAGEIKVHAAMRAKTGARNRTFCGVEYLVGAESGHGVTRAGKPIRTTRKRLELTCLACDRCSA